MERPVDLKTGKSKTPKGATPKDEQICMIYFASTPEKDVRQMTEQSFDKIKKIAKIRLAHLSQSICQNYWIQPDKTVLDDAISCTLMSLD